MSLLTRAAETYVPLALVCEHVGYRPDPSGLRALRKQLRRKGFRARRVGNHFTIQVGVWQAYLDRCAQDDAAHRARMAALAHARWADRQQRGARSWKS